MPGLDLALGLYMAAYWGKAPLVKYLLSRGADPDEAMAKLEKDAPDSDRHARLGLSILRAALAKPAPHPQDAARRQNREQTPGLQGKEGDLELARF